MQSAMKAWKASTGRCNVSDERLEIPSFAKVKQSEDESEMDSDLWGSCHSFLHQALDNIQAEPIDQQPPGVVEAGVGVGN